MFKTMMATAIGVLLAGVIWYGPDLYRTQRINHAWLDADIKAHEVTRNVSPDELIRRCGKPVKREAFGKDLVFMSYPNKQYKDNALTVTVQLSQFEKVWTLEYDHEHKPNPASGEYVYTPWASIFLESLPCILKTPSDKRK